MSGIITAEDLRRSAERIASVPQSQGDRLVQEMAARQPGLLSYLLAADPVLFTDDELGSILFYGMVLWEAVAAALPAPVNVSTASLERAEEWNLILLQGLGGRDNSQQPPSDLLEALDRYPEVEALVYLIQSIFPGHETSPEAGFREEVQYFAFFHLKVALDAMLSLPPGDDPVHVDTP